MASTPLPGAGDFPSNNKLDKKAPPKERPKVQKVVSGTVTEHKQSVWKKIAGAFTIEDARGVGDFVLMDVVVPSIRNLVSDTLTTMIERALFGESRGRTSGIRSGATFGPYSQPHTNYQARSQASSLPWSIGSREPVSRRSRATHDFREVVIDNRQEASVVLDTLTQLVDMYEVATVADFYDACGLTSEYTDRNWGWNDLREAQIVRVHTGYLIQLPPPIVLK